MSAEIIVTGRSADSIATEIRVIVAQAQQVLTFAAVKIGQNLIEAKQLVPHGEWGNYIKHSCGFSQRTANNYMKLAQEVGNSQAFANLPYTKALALLALPEGDRESFAEANDAAAMSVRELERQIRELQDKADSLQIDNDSLSAELLAAQECISEANSRADGWRQDLAAAREASKTDRAELRELRGKLGAKTDLYELVEKENSSLRKQLESASSSGEISEAAAERLREEGRREEAAKVQSEFEALTAKTSADAARIAELERLLEAATAAKPVAAEPDAKAEIQRCVTQVGEGYNALLGYLLKADGRGDAATAAAIRKLVSEQIKVVSGKFGVAV